MICFCFLFFYYDIPKGYKKDLQTAYTFFEYAVFTFIFWINIKNPKIKRAIFIISVLFFCFQVFYLLTGKVKGLDSVPIGIETIIMLSYIFYFFYQSSKDLSTAYIYNHYGFWVSVGILIYLGGSFFFFILFDHLSTAQVETFGNMTFVAEIIKNILFALAIFIQTRFPFENKKQKPQSIPYLDLI
jgi:hypothetical protein